MTSSKRSASFRVGADRTLTAVLVTAALLAAGLVLWILLFVAREAAAAWIAVPLHRFWTDPSWHPTSGLYRLTPMVVATLSVTVGAMLLAAPLGIATGLFAASFAGKPWDRLVRRLLELLAGIPSVVDGLWGLTVLVPLVAEIRAPGVSLLAAMVVLAVMILPTVALTTDAALKRVDPGLLRSAAALGFDHTGTALFVALPAARSGIFAGLVLAGARALGETMAVLMVAGNAARIPNSLFDSVRPITANIALEMGYATQDHRSVLFASGLVLMMLVAALVVLSARLAPESSR